MLYLYLVLCSKKKKRVDFFLVRKVVFKFSSSVNVLYYLSELGYMLF